MKQINVAKDKLKLYCIVAAMIFVYHEHAFWYPPLNNMDFSKLEKVFGARFVSMICG
jgi:hypothetical protein